MGRGKVIKEPRSGEERELWGRFGIGSSKSGLTRGESRLKPYISPPGLTVSS